MGITRHLLKLKSLCRDRAYSHGEFLWELPVEYDTPEWLERIQEYVSKVAPVSVVLEENIDVDIDGHIPFEILLRDLPAHGHEDTYIHVVPETVDDPVRFVKNFMEKGEERCCSLIGDPLIRKRDALFAIVMQGSASAVWDCDVWSDYDPITGRRSTTLETTGAPRTEAWVPPRTAKLVCVVTDVEEFVAALGTHGVTVVNSRRRGIEDPRPWWGGGATDEEDGWIWDPRLQEEVPVDVLRISY